MPKWFTPAAILCGLMFVVLGLWTFEAVMSD